MSKIFKRVILGLILLSFTAVLVACGENGGTVKDESIYTKEEMEAITEGIENNKVRIKNAEDTAKKLEEKKEEIIANNNFELLYDIMHEIEPPKSEKLNRLNEKAPPFGGEYLFVPYGGMGNKNQDLAWLLYFTNVMPEIAVDHVNSKVDTVNLWKHNIEHGETTLKEMCENEIKGMKIIADMTEKMNDRIEILSKEKKNTIPKLNDEQKKMVKEVLEVNNKNLPVIDKAIKDLESGKEDIIKNEDRDRIYGILGKIEKMDDTEYGKIYSETMEKMDPMQMDIVEQRLQALEIKDLGYERSRLARTLEYSHNVTIDLYGDSEEGRKQSKDLKEHMEVREVYETRLMHLTKTKYRIEEYNKVLENALNGKNYLIDNIQFYFGEVPENLQNMNSEK